MVFPTAFTVGNTLPVLVKVVCFSAFYIPLAIGLEWVQREQNMGMDVFLFLFRGVNGEIHAPICVRFRVAKSPFLGAQFTQIVYDEA